jgi:prepilin signal peptidase PulO-like enzyme (type II secretory pathway)
MLDRSRCPKCHEIIAWYDNIPLLSYLLLGGHCRRCRQPISVQYPLVELAGGILFVLAFSIFEKGFIGGEILAIVGLLKYWFVIAIMLVIFVFDLRWYMILDKVTLPAGIVLFFVWLFEESQMVNLLSARNTWLELIFTLLIGYGFFAVQYYGSKGKWLGGGDVKLGVVMALALATPGKIVAAIFLSYILGAIVGVGLIALGKKEFSSKLPFGTFLAVATIAMLLYGQQIIEWYMKFTGL